MSTRSSDRIVAARLALLGVVLLLGGLAIARSSRIEPAPVPVSLAALPLDIEGWRGRDTVRFTPAVEQVLGADDYVNRVYAAADGTSVSLYVGYYASQRQGDAIHSPMNCLPGAGWQPVSNGRIGLTVADGNGAPHALRLNQYVVQKGAERLVVLYWYQSHGRTVASEYVSRAWLVYDAIRMNRTDAALVRIITPIADSETGINNAADRAAAFVAAVFPAVAALLPA